MAKTTIGSPDDWGKLLLIASALVALGVLPKGWKGPIGAAGTVLTLIGIARKLGWI